MNEHQFNFKVFMICGEEPISGVVLTSKGCKEAVVLEFGPILSSGSQHILPLHTQRVV